MKRLFFASGAIAAAVIGGGLWWMNLGDGRNRAAVNAGMHGAGSAAVAPELVIVPERLSGRAVEGVALFEANCVACHGRNAAGSAQGPPLVHRIYEPGHHGDYAFQMAVRNGVRAHHWRFGNMPPVPGLSETEVTLITTYVRELQRASGIE